MMDFDPVYVHSPKDMNIFTLASKVVIQSTLNEQCYLSFTN